MSPGDEVNKVVEKLAEKIGVAVEKLAPIAETLVRETVALGWVTLAVSVTLLLLGLLIAVLGWKGFCRLRDATDTECALPVVILSAFATLGLWVFGLTHLFGSALPRIVSPTRHLLGL